MNVLPLVAFCVSVMVAFFLYAFLTNPKRSGGRMRCWRCQEDISHLSLGKVFCCDECEAEFWEGMRRLNVRIDDALFNSEESEE